MFARIAKCIPKLERKEEFLKNWRQAPRTQKVAAGNGMTHDESILEWARGLAFILALVLIILVISIAGR